MAPAPPSSKASAGPPQGPGPAGPAKAQAKAQASPGLDERSASFRTRRLSYTSLHPGGSSSLPSSLTSARKRPCEEEEGEADGIPPQPQQPQQQQQQQQRPRVRPRFLPPSPPPSSPPSQPPPPPRTARTLHAMPPPEHVRGERAHVLYRHANASEEAAHLAAVRDGDLVADPGMGRGGGRGGDGGGGEGGGRPRTPAWRTRKFVRHPAGPGGEGDQEPAAPAPSLGPPFPRDVVGMYSCHGVEPLYDDSDSDSDSDFGSDGSDGDEGDEGDEGDGLLPPGGATAAKINQDRGGVAYPYGGRPRTALFAAYDGHGDGGELVAQYALHEVERRLEAHPAFGSGGGEGGSGGCCGGGGLGTALRDTLLAVDGDLGSVPGIDPTYAGSTACVVLLRDGTLTVANAGDSRAVLGQRAEPRPYEDGQAGGASPAPDLPGPATETPAPQVRRTALDLTVDHNPDSKGERERIESSGGYVSLPPEPGLSARVWLDPAHTEVGLAMSRSLGDHAVRPVGVIADPVITSHPLIPRDEFLVLATDGVWEFVTSQDAIDLVARHLDAGDGASRACQGLIEEAAARWHEHEGDYRDDITALVVTFDRLWDQS